MSEHCLTRSVARWLARQGDLWFRKMHGSGFSTRGTPDFLLCVHGRFLAIELKVNGNRPTRLQNHELAKIAGAGGTSAVARSVEDVRELVESLRNKHR
jgi:Holliday junction resolvase